MKRLLYSHWPLAVALVVYALFSRDLNFTQDDAFISFRVVQNFLDGHGLVFNIGEYVEGYTNFGWVIYMIFTGVLGLGYIAAAKITGFLCGAGIIVVTHLLSHRVFADRNPALAFLPTLIVGVNMSLAYWAPAGLETAAFGLMAMLSLYLYVRRSWLLIWSLLLAVWLRPEGALLTGIIIIIDAIRTRGVPRYTLLAAAAAFVLSLPMVGFKLFYYGGILPNPFYAKTGMDIAQLANGLDYTWQYLYHYGAFGIGLLIPLLLWKKTSDNERTIWYFTLLYTAYIVLVGGDVLSVHRFFVPLMGAYAILIALGLWFVVSSIRLSIRVRQVSYLLVGLAVIAVSLVLPRDHVMTYNQLERNFTRKMALLAERLDASDNRVFSVALPTIGIFSYTLPGHYIIDMLGLTDSTIARHSEPPIEGMRTTWKEAKHNSAYILGQAPDYILFSTGAKPSAPAERALMLYPQFLQAYRTIGWHLKLNEGASGTLETVFKRVRSVAPPFKPTYPIEWVNNYKRGLDEFSRGRHRDALMYFRSAVQASERPYYPYLLYRIGFSYLMLGDPENARTFYDAALEHDNMVWETHQELLIYAYADNDTAAIRQHREAIEQLVPWYLPRADSLARQSVGQVKPRSSSR